MFAVFFYCEFPFSLSLESTSVKIQRLLVIKIFNVMNCWEGFNYLVLSSDGPFGRKIERHFAIESGL